jgi:Fic family protein
MEFIHPFEDGNGRMGRFWQTRLLMQVHPLFEYIPIEETIRNHQKEYYKVLSIADKSGSSTQFIEFILQAVNRALRNTIDESKIPKAGYHTRTEYTLPLLNDWFDRKDYMKINKGISTATASRDLKQLLEDGTIESEGTGRMTKYRKKAP